MGLAVSKLVKAKTLRRRSRSSTSSLGAAPWTGDRVNNPSPPLPCVESLTTRAMDNKDPNIIWKLGTRTIEKFEPDEKDGYGNSTCVEKYGDGVVATEATAMRLIATHTDVPIPKLLDTFFYDGHGQVIMTYVPGLTLAQAWPDMTDENKTMICTRIWEIIGKIRLVPQPTELEGHYLCLADGSPSEDPLVKESEDTKGPLATDADVRARIYARYYECNGRKYEKILPDMLPRSTQSVFTHADIAPRNIMVDSDYNITAVLDWETAGWYPDYWELVRITGPASRCVDWQKWMLKYCPDKYKCDLQGIVAARGVLF